MVQDQRGTNGNPAQSVYKVYKKVIWMHTTYNPKHKIPKSS